MSLYEKKIELSIGSSNNESYEKYKKQQKEMQRLLNDAIDVDNFTNFKALIEDICILVLKGIEPDFFFIAFTNDKHLEIDIKNLI